MTSELPTPRESGQRPGLVVLMGHTSALGGAEIAMLRLLAALDRNRYQPTVLLFSSGPLADTLRDLGERVILVPLADAVNAAERSQLTPAAMLTSTRSIGRFMLALRRQLRLVGPDVVHTNSMKAHLLGALASRSVGVPVVCYVHDRISADYLPRRVALVVGQFLRRVPSYLLVNSESTGRTLQPLTAGRWSVAYPGIDVSGIDVSGSAATEQSLPVAGAAGHRVVGILGRISPTKGQHLFVQAAAQLADSHPDIRFRILGAALFGEDDYAAQLHQTVHDLGLVDRVEFAGWTDDVPAALRELDLLVHASPVPEPFGQVLVEAMAAGVPVIGTRAGGVPEILQDADGNCFGQLVAPGDPSELAAAIARALDDPAASGQRAANARRWVVEQFSDQSMANAVMAGWDIARRRGL